MSAEQLRIAKSFGLSTRNERKQDVHTNLLTPIFNYIDTEGEGTISCFQLADWLGQMGLQVSPTMIYEHVSALKYKDDEKPKIENCLLSVQDFDAFVGDKGYSTARSNEFKAAFEQYIKAEAYIERNLRNAKDDVEVAKLQTNKIGDWHHQIEQIRSQQPPQFPKDKVILKDLFFEMQKLNLLSNQELALYKQFFGPGDKEMPELLYAALIRELDKREIV